MKITTLMLALLAGAPAFAQDQGGRELPPIEEVMGPGGEAVDELVKLFHAVEANLRRIDAILNDASSGDVPLGVPEDSGLDDLLRATQADGRKVVEDIDRILEVARSRAQSQSSSGQGSEPQPGQPGESPLDQQRGDRPQGSESTPDAPDPQGSGQDRGGDKPKDGRASDDPGATRPGRELDPGETGDPSRPPRDQEPWGMLPAKVQEIFRNEGSEDVPVQYRDWIDAYYRRLNESRPR